MGVEAAAYALEASAATPLGQATLRVGAEEALFRARSCFLWAPGDRSAVIRPRLITSSLPFIAMS